MDNRQSHHTHELHRHLLESSADASAFLQPADGLSDDAPSSSGPLVEHRAAIVTQQLLVVTRDKRCNAVSAQPVTDTMITIALVTREHRRPLVWRSEGLRNRDLVHHGLDAGRDVHLSVGDFNFQRQASTVSNQVKLAAESASRQAQSMVLRLTRVPMAAFFPAPAAARADRTDEPPMHQRSLSISPSASSRMWRASQVSGRTRPPSSTGQSGRTRPATDRTVPACSASSENPRNAVEHQTRIRGWPTRLHCASGEGTVNRFPLIVRDSMPFHGARPPCRDTVYSSMTPVTRLVSGRAEQIHFSCQRFCP